MADPTTDEPLLTFDQAYLAAYYFIRQFYERDGRRPESMYFLLNWMRLQGPRMSSDPAQWHDWVTSTARAMDADPNQAFAEPLPPPLSQ
jgi:hypothetical protein